MFSTLTNICFEEIGVVSFANTRGEARCSWTSTYGYIQSSQSSVLCLCLEVIRLRSTKQELRLWTLHVILLSDLNWTHEIALYVLNSQVSNPKVLIRIDAHGLLVDINLGFALGCNSILAAAI